jgi:hypothetical protein
VASYQITLKDRTTEIVNDADAYQQEGPLTTFFATRDNRHVIDAWSTRIASIRTTEIALIRRLENPAATASPLPDHESGTCPEIPKLRSA